jgi:hypothetical protein
VATERRSERNAALQRRLAPRRGSIGAAVGTGDRLRLGTARPYGHPARVAPRRLALLVAGDEAADFALALAWDRLYGPSLWPPSEWQPSLDVKTSEMTTIRLVLGDFGFDASCPDGQVQLTTASLGPEAMTKLAGALDSR